jgi:hypothetical protein
LRCRPDYTSWASARNGAWLSLIGSVHWKMLADLLGVTDTTASAWHRENGGDRASYVASRLRQSQPHRCRIVGCSSSSFAAPFERWLNAPSRR